MHGRRMLRGYIRERKKGPSVDEQRAALIKAGVRVDGTHPPIYVDMVPRRGQPPQPQLIAAVQSLRSGDTLVVFDEASLGLTEGGLWEAHAAIGERAASLMMADGRIFDFTPQTAEIAGLIANGAKILTRENARVRNNSGPILGRPKLLSGDVMRLARELWGRQDLSARQIAAEIQAQTGVKVGIRTLFLDLGHKTDAVEKAAKELRKAKTPVVRKQPKRRKRRDAKKEKPNE